MFSSKVAIVLRHQSYYKGQYLIFVANSLFTLQSMKLTNLCSQTEQVQKLLNFIESLESKQDQFVFSTSGSTGQPKQIVFNRNQLEISAGQTIDFFRLKSSDVLLCPFSMDYVAAKMMVVRAFVLDAELIFTGPVGNPMPLLGNLQAQFAALVPLQMQQILGEAESLAKLNVCQNVIVGGAPISLLLEKQIREQVSSAVYQTYGMTETLTHVALRRINGKNADATYYKALKGVSLKLAENGTLAIKSPLQDDWLQTNDLAEIGAEGFRWLGRLDLVINSGGHKINIEYLEDVINSEWNDSECFICGISSDKLGEQTVMLLKKPMVMDTFKTWAKQSLHRYEIPKLWLAIDQMPMLPNGKTDRQALKKIAEAAAVDGRLQVV
ncbi:AMP-binding protein [bacterium]|nr:AMP-binding protein [bacterium]